MVVHAGELKKANIQGGVREIVRRYSSQLGHVFKFPAKFMFNQMTLIQLIFIFKRTRFAKVAIQRCYTSWDIYFYKG